MPLRDHFRAPLDNQSSWEELYGQWPAMIVMALAKQLPPRYVAAPRVHLGSSFEIDVATFERDRPVFDSANGNAGGVATAVWKPARPSLTFENDLPDQAEYEVRIYDTQRGRRLVAAIEIVSPSNKDGPENRSAFVTKCASLLRQLVSVTIIDLVTTRTANLYSELLDNIGGADPALKEPLYAASCREIKSADGWRMETWAHALRLGEPLPTLPLWLEEDFAIPLELEPCYEETCRILRIS